MNLDRAFTLLWVFIGGVLLFAFLASYLSVWFFVPMFASLIGLGATFHWLDRRR